MKSRITEESPFCAISPKHSKPSHIYNSTKYIITTPSALRTKKIDSFELGHTFLDNQSQCDVVYTDFTKAFDKIDHFILLEKLLNRLEFPSSLIKLFTSYLRQRQFAGRYRNFTSRSFIPSSGVPQGSNLGPLLFLLFIDDVTDVIPRNKLIYADDFKLYAEINSTNDCFFL